MNDSTPRRLARWVLKIVPATLVITLVTDVCYGLHATFSTVSLLYLVVVVMQSLIGDFISSALVSVVGTTRHIMDIAVIYDYVSEAF